MPDSLAAPQDDRPDPPGLARSTVIAGCLFLSLFLLYVGTSRLAMVHGDDRSMHQVTAALVDRRELSLPDPPEEAGLAQGPDGRPYSKYGIGLSIVAAPIYVVGRWLHDDRGWRPDTLTRQELLLRLTMLMNPIVTAATAAVLWTWLTRLRLGTAIATGTAFLYGVATLAWHYASATFFSEPLAGLCLLLGVAAAWRAGSGPVAAWAFISGGAAGLLVATRAFNVLVLPILAGFLLSHHRRPVRAVAAWLALVVAWGLLIAYYNAARFGAITETGYGGEAQAFVRPPWEGAFGLFLTPGKGLLFFAPILLIGFLGIRPLGRREPRLTIAIGAILLVHLVGFGSFLTWWGGGSWGPRFLVPLVPLLAVFVAAGLPALIRRRAGRLCLTGLVAVSVIVQLGSVLIGFGTYWGTLDLFYRLIPGTVPEDHIFRQTYDPVFSPILGHLWLLSIGQRWVIAGIDLQSAELRVLQTGAVTLAVVLAALTWRLTLADRLSRPDLGPLVAGLTQRMRGDLKG